MTKLRRAITRVVRAAGTPWRWWTGLEAAERVLYRAVALLAIGSAMIYPALGFIVPGALFAIVFMQSTRRPG